MSGRRDEREAWARYLLGLLLSDNCSYKRAEALLRDAVDYMPELVAAHVELGVVYSGLEQYEEMLAEFREAIRLDVSAVRETVRDEPKELDELRRVLYPQRETATSPRRDSSRLIPTHVYASTALVEQGAAEMAAGRDVQAVDFLERALRLDPSNSYPVTMLALAYVLCWESEGKTPTVNEGSVLWEVATELAEVLFKGVEAGGESHNNGQE
jgi:tetratricopeptide (TPR) repeat protein